MTIIVYSTGALDLTLLVVLYTHLCDGNIMYVHRVWLSNDRANQSSMMDYATEYLNHGIQVSYSFLFFVVLLGGGFWGGGGGGGLVWWIP